MSTMKDREKAFENKYAHDAEMNFKAEARRNRLLGIWAAEKMGMTGEDVAEYAKSVVIADLEEAGDEDVFRKVMGDLKDRAVSVSDTELRAKMSELLAEAKHQVMSEAGD